MKKIIRIIKILISTIYPNKCICCGELIDEDKFTCETCNNLLERNDLNDICLSCGLEKSDCVCRFNVYRFNSLICVFKNEGRIKKAYYAYKFAKKQHYVDFFTQELYCAVKKCYDDIKFDFICSVPCAKKFAYDHSGYIAQKLSDLLEIPYVPEVLYCAKRIKKQHQSNIKDRINNVDGKFGFNKKIPNATVLLIDDIKTTGATIDECAKMLLFAGAENVHCICALGTISKKHD